MSPRFEGQFDENVGNLMLRAVGVQQVYETLFDWYISSPLIPDHMCY